jgi:hypothetical protein
MPQNLCSIIQDGIDVLDDNQWDMYDNALLNKDSKYDLESYTHYVKMKNIIGLIDEMGSNLNT